MIFNRQNIEHLNLLLVIMNFNKWQCVDIWLFDECDKNRSKHVSSSPVCRVCNEHTIINHRRAPLVYLFQSVFIQSNIHAGIADACWNRLLFAWGHVLYDAGTCSSALSQLTMDLNKNIVLQLEKAVCRFKSTYPPPPPSPSQKLKIKNKQKSYFFK